MRPLVFALLLALAATVVRSEPRVIGRTESNVRILRGKAADSTAAGNAPSGVAQKAGDDVDLAGPPPASTSPEALALARRLGSAFRGKSALTAWLERGERRGTPRGYVSPQGAAAVLEPRGGGGVW